MLDQNFKLSKSTVFLLFFLFLISFFSIPNYSQTTSKPEYSGLLDSVKTFYGDTCYIGVSSKLIKRLYEFQKYTPVRNYLNSYEFIRKTILDFRDTYKKAINNDEALLLDLSRIFKVTRQQNIVNAAGIYLGPDNVTSIGLSYIILRSNPIKFHSNLYQIANFDNAFKKEITNYGTDWYNSIKLEGLNRIIIK